MRGRGSKERRGSKRRRPSRPSLVLLHAAGHVGYWQLIDRSESGMLLEGARTFPVRARLWVQLAPEGRAEVAGAAEVVWCEPSGNSSRPVRMGVKMLKALRPVPGQGLVALDKDDAPDQLTQRAARSKRLRDTALVMAMIGISGSVGWLLLRAEIHARRARAWESSQTVELVEGAHSPRRSRREREPSRQTYALPNVTTALDEHTIEARTSSTTSSAQQGKKGPKKQVAVGSAPKSVPERVSSPKPAKVVTAKEAPPEGPKPVTAAEVPAPHPSAPKDPAPEQRAGVNVKADPKAADPCEKSAQLLRERKALLALTEADHCLAENPGARGHKLRGAALALLGRDEQAVAAFKRALDLDPDAPDAERLRRIVDSK